LESTGSLKSNSSLPLKTILSFFILFSTLHSKSFIINSLCYALEEGGAGISVENRTISQETSFIRTYDSETIYHLDAWQNATNVGKFSLWLDWANAHNDEGINRLGRGFFSLRGFRLSDSTLDGLVGDTTTRLTNLPEKFSNAAYPDVYLRGLQTDLFSGWGEGHVFGGKVARLNGLLGEIYAPTDESFYGFRGNFRPIPSLLLGTGFIRTQDEVDNADRPVTQSNNLFLVDSEWEFYKRMKLVGEFSRSDYRGEPGVETQSDYALRIGPILTTEKIKFESNFRRIGTFYRSVNEATQAVKDQQGFFSLAEYRPWKELTLFGNADLFHDNVANIPDRNTTDTQRGMLGVSFFSAKYPSFYLTFDVTDRKSRSDFPFPQKNLTSTVLSEVRYQYGDLNPYARYRRAEFKDDITPVNEYIQNVITLGLRKDLKPGSIAYVEGELDQKEFQVNGKDTRISGKIGLIYYYSQKFSCWGEVTYSRLQENSEIARRNLIEGFLGFNYQLPWGIQLYGDFRYDKNLNLSTDELKAQGYQITIRVIKRFKWGSPEKIAGLRPEVETKGTGVVEGVVFNDINRNGVQDKGEEGIKDVTIRLEDGSTVKTDEKGYYQFGRVEAGSHLVTLDGRRIPADYSMICPEKVKVDVKFRKTVQVHFQLIAAGRIEGRIINDANGNGKFDPDEKGIPDVLVLLEPGGNNAYTDEDGKFTFENVIPGEYTLKLDPATLPEDAVLTSPAELKSQLPVGAEIKDMNFLIHVKPRPISIGPPKK
jgi:SdrD B-like domain